MNRRMSGRMNALPASHRGPGSITGVRPPTPAAFVALALCLLVLPPASPAQAQSRAVPGSMAGRRVFAEGGRSFDAGTGALRRWFDVQSSPYAGAPQEAARTFLSQQSAPLGMRPALEDIEYVGIKHGLGTEHVRFRQTLQGVPVFGSDVVVSLDQQRRVSALCSDYWPGLSVKDGAPVVDGERAAAIAVEDRGGAASFIFEPCWELQVYPLTDPPSLAWRVVFKPADTDAMWEVFVDAVSGGVLSSRDLTWRVDGSGFVFDPDPLTTAHAVYGDPGFEDFDNATTPQLDQERKLRDLYDILLEAGHYYLAGPHATILEIELPAEPDYSTTDPDAFTYTRADKGFEAVMAYYHVDIIQRWIQALGFTDVNNESQKLDPHGLGGADNSHYCPYPGDECSGAVVDYIAFGEGGVDDAEDAEIIVHEYGHAVQDDQVPGWGLYYEGRCMGEGFSDYLAAGYGAAIDDFNDNWFAHWDNAGADGNPGMRPLDSTAHYPEDMIWILPNNKPAWHTDGQIWSACLWQIHAQFGRVVTDRIVIQSHFLLVPGACFRDGALALLQADQDLYGGTHRAFIETTFRDRGILRSQPFDVSRQQVERSPSVAFEACPNWGSEYLVVWDQRADAFTPDAEADIMGARVAPSGAVITTDLPQVTTADGEANPDVAYVARLESNGEYYAFLTAFTRYNHADHSISMGLARTEWDGMPFGVATIPTQGFNAAVAPVADTSGVTLIVWNGPPTPDSPGYGVFAVRWSAKTGLLDAAPFTIVTPSADRSENAPDVACDGTKFLVVWLAQPPGDPAPPLQIKAAVVRRDGGVGPIFTVGTAGTDISSFPSVCFDGTNFLVVWARNTSGHDLYGARVDTSGVVLDPAGFRITNGPGLELFPSVQRGCSQALVTYSYAFGDWSIRGVRVNPDATVPNPGGFLIAPILHPEIRDPQPMLDFGGMSHLVVWQDSLVIKACVVTDSACAAPVTGVGETGPSPPPVAALLGVPHPNPTHAGTVIYYTVPAGGTGSLRVYDMSGRLVRRLVEGPVSEGEHAAVWDGTDESRRRVSAGVYFIRWSVGRGVSTRRVVVLR